jgi:hypothetical protein
MRTDPAGLRRVLVFSLAALAAAWGVPQGGRVPPATGGRPGPGVQAPGTRTLQSNQLKIRLNQKPKLAFQPFAMVDPQTGRPVTASTVIEVPNPAARGEKVAPGFRSRMTAGEFYGKLNSLERQFNELGYSLRSPAENEVVQRSIVDRLKLRQGAENIRLKHPAFDALKMPPMRSAGDFSSGSVARRGAGLFRADLAKFIKQADKPEISKSWNLALGEPETVSAYLRGRFDAAGSKTTATISGEMSLGGAVLNRSAEVCKVTGRFVAPAAGNTTGTFDLLLFGKNVYSKSVNQALGYTWAPTSMYPKLAFRERIGEKIRFNLGPVPMSGEVGAFGEVGAKWSVLFQPLRVAANVNPYAFVGVYAEIGPDIEILAAGVGCDLVLCRDDIVLDGECVIENVTEPQPSLLMRLAGKNVMEMLAGKFYVYVKYWVPFKTKRKTWDIFEWEGLKVNGVLFNTLEKSVSL